MQRKACISSLLALTTALSAMPMHATFAQSDDSDINVDEIFVTARNRAESLQDVPLAITAFSADDLRKRNIQELDDIARFTSGFSFEDFSGGFAQPVIRGQAQTRVTALETNVSAFFDGIYIPRSWAVDIGTTNLERIEVVKGPQSARYGRNAFSGAINYLPRKAVLGEQVVANAAFTVGSDERYDAGGFISFSPIESIAIAASVNYSSFDGSWENDHPFADADLGLGRGTEGNVGGWDNISYSLTAAFEPTDRLHIEAGYYRFDVENEARASRYLASGNGDTNGGVNNRLFVGQFAPPGDTTLNDPRGYAGYAETDIVRVGIDYDITDELTLSYLYGHIEGTVDIATSGEPDPINCGTVVGPPVFPPLCNFQNAPIGGINYDSHEVRLSYESGQWRGAIGGFYSAGEDLYQFNSISIAPITDANDFVSLADVVVPTFNFATGPFAINLADEFTTTDVISGFAEAYFTSEDGRLRFGAEARFSSTEISTTDQSDPTADVLSDTFNVFTPRITAEYDITDQSLAYATIARGTKAGGFNASAIAPENRVFDPEFNWTYEIGFKNQFFDDRLTLNIAAYYTDWNDIQINSADPDADDPNAVTITQNLGNARILGFEADARIQFNDYISVDATFSHADAIYSDGTIDNRFSRTPSPCDDIVCNSNGDIGGNEVERTPASQASLGAQYTAPMDFKDGEYYVRVDTSWQSSFFADSANVAEIEDRFLVNMQIGMTFENVNVSLWARNLLDKQYVANAFVVLLPFGNTYGNFFGERRTFGLSANFNY